MMIKNSDIDGIVANCSEKIIRIDLTFTAI